MKIIPLINEITNTFNENFKEYNNQIFVKYAIDENIYQSTRHTLMNTVVSRSIVSKKIVKLNDSIIENIIYLSFNYFYQLINYTLNFIFQ